MKLILETGKSICPNCKREIKAGEMVTWTQAGGDEQHVSCSFATEPDGIVEKCGIFTRTESPILGVRRPPLAR